jgi:signal transduction histidine kinase/CheY-like chemotaxis protein
VDLPKPSSGSPAASPELRGAAVDGRPAESPPETRRRPIAMGLSSPERLRQELAQAQRMETIGQLVPGIAHELNNPLAAIMAFSQLIFRDARLPADLRHDAELLIGEAARTRRIVQNLLDFARRRAPERHATDLRPLIDSVLDLQSYAIGAHGIQVEVVIEPDVPPVPLDRSQMQQVLLNLTLNAIQSLRAMHGGRLRVHAAVTRRGMDSFVAVSVADDGPGVGEELRDRIFVPFFTTKSPDEATGLGLPVAADIVAAHGGALRLEPAAAGQGAAFVVELPITSGVATEPSASGAPRVATASGPPPGDGADGRAKRARILVVDDEPSIRRFLFKALENAGFEPILAATGQDAIDVVRDSPVDGILSDHRMAGLSGTDVYDAAVAIRPELRDRFVFMSGDVLNPALRDFADAHGIVLLAKPFDLASVGRTVRDLLERTASR